MSYNEELITKISHNTEKDTCCRLALISAVVKVDGSILISSENKIKLEMKINNLALARRIMQEFKSLFGLNATVGLKKIQVANTTQSLVAFQDPHLLNIFEKLEIINNNNINLGLPTGLIKRSCCKKSFIRGVFLAGGYISSSSKNPHLEISVQNEHLIEEVSKMLKIKHIDNKKRMKNNNLYSLYIKNAEAILSFLKLIGVTSEVLDFENIQIIKNLKNQANRLTNAETANKNKIIKNSYRQIKEINLIENEIGLNKLPRALLEICKIRLTHPNDSLQELGLKLNPPISKSAVNHRLRRIRDIVNKLIG